MDTGPRFSTSNILFTYEMLHLIRFELVTNWYIFSSNCLFGLFFEIGAVGDCERTSTHTMLTNLIGFACLLSSSDCIFTCLQALGSRMNLYPSSWESVEKVFWFNRLRSSAGPKKHISNSKKTLSLCYTA